VIGSTVNTNAPTGLSNVSITASDTNGNSTTQTFSIDVIGTASQLPRINFTGFNDPLWARPLNPLSAFAAGALRHSHGR